MKDGQRVRDLEWLDLDPDAGDAEVIAECRRRLTLYAGDHPAIYSLMSEEERHRMLARIDGILSRLKKPDSGPPLSSTPVVEDSAEGVPAAPDSEAGPAPDPATSPGDFLRYLRRSCGMDLREISAETKVSERQLEAIEEEDFSALPAPVFVRGFIIAVARALKVEKPEELAGIYLEKIAGGGS